MVDVDAEISKALDAGADKALELFRQSVGTWNNPAAFEVIKTADSREIGSDDMKLLWVEDGTRPHVIRGAPLAFPSGFTAKTIPAVIPARAGGGSGATVFTREVNHPGTKPRKRYEKIAKLAQEATEKAIESAIERIFA